MTVFDIIERLQQANIHFCVSAHRDEAVTITAHVPGEHWEIDVFEDGRVDLEVFASSGAIHNEEALSEKIKIFSD